MKKIIILVLVSIFITSCSDEKIIEKPINNQEKETAIMEDEISIMEKINNETKDNIAEISEKVEKGDITSEEAEKLMMNSINNSDTIKSQLKIQKEKMPKMLEILKENRECFEDVDNQSDAEDCIKKSIILSKRLGVEDFYGKEDDDIYWVQSEKKEMLVEMDEAIKEIEKMIPCILDAKVMTDMMKCSIEK